MKKLTHSLFNKFESNKVINLAKIIGGAPQNTTYTGCGGSSGCDTINLETKEGIEIDLKDHGLGKYDFKDVACAK